MGERSRKKRERRASQKRRSPFLEKVCKVCREEVLRRFQPSSCIVSTRVVIEVLKEFCIPARPVVASAIVMNSKFAECLESYGRLPDHVTSWEWREKHGAISFGLARRSDPQKNWPAHMVAIADSDKGRYLLDPSLDQLNHLGHSCVLKPFVCSVGRAFLGSGEPHCEDLEKGWSVFYVPDITDNSWINSPNWEQWGESAQEALRRLCPERNVP